MPAHSSQALKAYGDLMIKIVTNTIYEDGRQEPWSNGKFNNAARINGRDWPSNAHTMIGAKRLESLRDMVCSVLEEDIPGDFIETGVWRGGACILMRGLLEAHGDTTRKVFVADSFEGLPEPNPEKYPDDEGDKHSTFSQLAISLEQVQKNFAQYDLLDEQVVFKKGWFKDTLPELKGRPFSILRLDGDMYESTMDALDNLYDSLSSGGYCIIDDYGAVEACKKAVTDFRRDHNIDAPLNQIDWTGYWWRKP